MFIGRENELRQLEKIYNRNSFEFVIMYGRRRIGKTELLKEFVKDKNALFFSAIEKQNNLYDFSKAILSHFNEQIDLEFSTWSDAFKYISNHGNDKELIIIDEFPYIVKEEPEVKSILQHIIDHEWQNKNIMLILCGSSVSFMVNDVLSSKSPLYGRNTSVMEILPFEYYDVCKFLPSYSKEDQMIVYGILGGVPYYLMKFKDNVSLIENIKDTIIDNGAPLREEPITLLRSELREPMVYNSILEAIANGANKLNEIADKAKIQVTKIPVYINNLIEMKIVKKIVCCGEKENSKKSQYLIKDNFFSFWYRFVFSNKTKVELMDPLQYVQSIKNELYEYMGLKFENICYQYLKKDAKQNKLPFIPQTIGKWWGGNPITKKQDDIDILGIDNLKYIFCECKFRNENFDLKEFNDLINSSKIFNDAKEKYFYIFIKSSFTESVIKESKKYNVKLITINEM